MSLPNDKTSMHFVVRADASRAIGHGHVMRCLTLASALRERGALVSFVCREHEGHLCDQIANQGFAVSRLPAVEASWERDADDTGAAVATVRSAPVSLVVDHYGVDLRWEAKLRPSVRQIMVIDDLANRAHDCDLLLDQNFFVDATDRYRGLLPLYCTPFLGPEYVLLRQEFRDAKRSAHTARGPRLLIFFGGGDPTGQCEAALEAALQFDASVPVDVIVGRNNPRAEAIETRYRHLPQVRLLRQSDNMAELMAGASLCLGAGGIATFERLFMELPSIVVSTADNQREPLRALADVGCIEYLGEAEAVGKADWLAALRRRRSHAVGRIPFAVGSRTARVVSAMQVDLVPFSERHIENTFHFLQDSSLRGTFAIREAPEWDRHMTYWQQKLACADEAVFAVEHVGEHVGNCGVKRIPHSADWEGWIYLAPGVQRRGGIGEVAFRRLMRIALHDMNLPRLFLHVRRDNEAALGLYRKLGFLEAPDPVDPRVWGERSVDMCKWVIAK
jgi:UDP-2,4-diacetamido-2,4,6-trideoxy-beta-L-altropyranose hydrolase